MGGYPAFTILHWCEVPMVLGVGITSELAGVSGPVDLPESEGVVQPHFFSPTLGQPVALPQLVLQGRKIALPFVVTHVPSRISSNS